MADRVSIISVKSPDRLVMGPVLAFALSIVIYSAITAVFITAMVYFTAQTSENIESVVVSSTELEAQGFTCDSLSETTLAGPPIAEPEWPAFNFNSQCGLLLGTFVGHPSELTQFHKVYWVDCRLYCNGQRPIQMDLIDCRTGIWCFEYQSRKDDIPARSSSQHLAYGQFYPVAHE